MDLDLMAMVMGAEDFPFWMEAYCASLTGQRASEGRFLGDGCHRYVNDEEASRLAICDADQAVAALKAKRLAMVEQAKQKAEARDTALVRAIDPWTGEALRDAHAKLNGDVLDPWVMERPEVRRKYEELALIVNQRMGNANDGGGR